LLKLLRGRRVHQDIERIGTGARIVRLAEIEPVEGRVTGIAEDGVMVGVGPVGDRRVAVGGDTVQVGAIDRDAGGEAVQGIRRGIGISAHHTMQVLGGRRAGREVDDAVGDRADRRPVILEDEQRGEVERGGGVVAVLVGRGPGQHHEVGAGKAT